MRKIYNEVILRWNDSTEKYEEVSSDHYYVDDKEPVLLFGGGGGEPSGSTQSTTVQKADPWEGQQPYLKKVFGEAEKLYNTQGPNFFPGSTIAPNSAETNLAQAMQVNRALNGSPVQGAATNELTKTLSGDYLYGGDGFNAAVDSATRKILPVVNSSFERAGRTGSGLASVAQTQAIADAFADQYGNERANQQRAMFFAPQIAAQDYADIGALADIGAQKEGLNQATLNEQIARYNFEQNRPMGKLADFNSLIQGNYGGSTSTLSSQPYYRNQGAGLLGGAMGGYQLGNSLFPAATGAMPFGGVGGAVLGGLLGGLF